MPGYHQLEEVCSGLGFKRDLTPDAPICRWRFDEIEVDLMPTDDAVLGFANRWYPLVAETCREQVLPSGTTIRLIAAPAFLATKFEAFSDRGQGDLLLSHDLEDIINVVDGRPELVDEVAKHRGHCAPTLAPGSGICWRSPASVMPCRGRFFPTNRMPRGCRS